MSTILIGAPVRLPPGLRDELLQVIRDQGFEPAVDGDQVEERGGPSSMEVLLWARDHLAGPIALALATSVARRIGRWRRDRKAKGPPPVVRVLYAPDGSELARVSVADELEET